MKKISFIAIFVFFLVPNTSAQDAQSVGREMRAEIIGQGSGSGNVSPTNITINASNLRNSSEEENKLISQQLDVITGDEETRYVIVPGDTLTISYNDRDVVNKAIYQVSSEGEIYLPLAGKTKIAGLNRKEAQDMVDQVLGEYIRNTDAQIRINMDGRVMVVGAVVRPGLVDLNDQPLTVMDALLNVGIQSYNPQTARLNSIFVMRGPVNKPIVIKLDLKKMIYKGDRSDNILLKPGDMIYVPTTFMSELDSFAGSLYQKYLMWSDMGGQNLIKPGKQFLNLSGT